MDKLKEIMLEDQTQHWRFIDNGTQDPATNMAIDEAVLLEHSQGRVPPTIRFYTWEPATLSIGYFQKVNKEINMDQVKAHRLGFVRRMTGGRAVLHDRELTYSVIVSEDHPHMPASITEAYRVISQGLLYGFRHLGLDAYFSTPDEEQKEVLRQPRSSVCFDASSWYELVVEGKKVAGSAQTRQKGVILQHGSIVLDFNVDQLFDVFHFPSERVKERMKKGFSTKAVAINDVLERAVNIEEVKEAFHKGFAEGLQIHMEEGALTEGEKQSVQKLIQSKYGNDEWNYRR